MAYKDREILYLVVVASVESSCCGQGGLAYILVPGYIISWKYGTDDTGLPVTEVNRINDDDEKREIEGILKRKYPHLSQITFMEGA